MFARSRTLEILESLAQADGDEGAPTEFLLIRIPGGAVGLKPGPSKPDAPVPSESEILDLESKGLVRTLPSNSETVLSKFVLTDRGRRFRTPSVGARIESPLAMHAQTSLDEVLSWLSGLESTPEGAAILSSGGALLNEAMSEFGEPQLQIVCERLLDLQAANLIDFEDPGAILDQILLVDQLGMASRFRLTVSGMDRLRHESPAQTSTVQIVNAVHAQIAAGDINNYASFDELLDGLEAAINESEMVDPGVRDEAKSILEKLRTAGGTAATGAAGSAGGALLGSVLKQLLGLP